MFLKIRIGLLIVLAGMLCVIAIAERRTEGARDAFTFDAATLKDRTAWTQVNDKPFYISSQVNQLCAIPTTDAAELERRRNPHVSTFITVYVNNIGRTAMFAKNPRFPEGSIIVKEKIRDYETRTPVLYTIMRKRERGYNPKLGDWEFLVVGPNGSEVQGKGRLENCQGCHHNTPESDFVFRTYVPSN